MKTLAIRLEDDLHAQLSVIAQLDGTTVTDFIRSAITVQLEAKRSQPELAAKAEEVLAEIDAEAATRRSAIADLFTSESANGKAGTQSGSRGRARRSPSGDKP